MTDPTTPTSPVTQTEPAAETAAEVPPGPPLDLDVLVVGAGIAGVDVACRLQRHCPDVTWAVVEARDAIGGTWDLFRYPGIRSDSDMYTLGFPFQPWRGESSIASGEEIRDYVRQTAHDHGVTERTHFGQRVERLEWSSADARWTATTRTRDGLVRHTARFVYLATGYYSYESGHLVDFPGQEDFAGEVVHPQHWPEGMPVAGRRVVVVGSGATAITLLPALVDEGASQRDDAPAQPELRRVAAVARRGRRRPAGRAAGCRGAPPRARQERAALDRGLPGAAPPPRGRPAAAAAPGAAPPARRLPRRHPLRAPLRPVGPAAVRGPRRRPVRGAVRRTGPSRDRHRRAVRARRHPAGSRASWSRPTSS